MSPRWFDERVLEGEAIRQSLRADEVLLEERTAHQNLALFRNRQFGTVLMLDGIVQLTSADEFIYHEMLAHVPILAHGAAREVAIIGGGDGGCAEEVLKHGGVERLTQVEIDPAVIDFSRKWLDGVNRGSFDDERMDLVFADGARFVAETERRFDVVIVDSTDPEGPGAALFTSEFYAGCKRCLKEGGVLVTQNGVPFLQHRSLASSLHALAALFADATAYVLAVPTYIGGHMTLGWASDDAALRQVPLQTLAERFAKAGISTRYYTPEVHQAAFALPRYIADIVTAAREGC